MLQRFLRPLGGLLIVIAVVVAVGAIGSEPVLLPARAVRLRGQCSNCIDDGGFERGRRGGCRRIPPGVRRRLAERHTRRASWNADATFRPAAVYRVRRDRRDVRRSGRFNGDGFPDLIVGNTGSASGQAVSAVTVLLGNGDGTFQSAVAL